MNRPAALDVPTLTISDDAAVVALLRTLQRAALLHPEAARALFQALVHEGRAFADTQDGARWRERVSRSELLSRALLVAQTMTFWMLEDGEPCAAPSALVEAVASAASVRGRDELIERLLRELEAGEQP